MGYRELIDWNIGTVYQTGIATKILQHMDRIRNVSDISQSRRWIMELFQNSRDVAYEERPVDIRVVLGEDRVTFSHSGKPFRVKDILSIINQVSSKSPEDSSVGQFGTGFMTTYQLSETVDIQAVLKDGDLPFKPFAVRLDRRGTTKEEILEGIFETMEQLKRADEAEDMGDFCPGAFNTSFIYHLDSRGSREAAYIGLEDLQETILYVFLFSEEIASVELVWETGERVRKVSFKRGEKAAVGGGLMSLSVERTEEAGGARTVTSQRAVWVSENDLTIAAGWDGEGFVPMSPKLPRLFVDFPLIGTENFPFPVVVNCRNFKVNESRSGITLVDNESSRDALVNKSIVGRAVKLYGRFLGNAVEMGFKRPDHVIAVPRWVPSREMSKTWVEEYLYRKLYGIISEENMIRTKGGAVSFQDRELYLLCGESREETDDLRRLVQVLRGIRIPEGEEDWNQALAGYQVPESKFLSLETVAARARNYLLDGLREEETDGLAWCQELYRAVMKNPGLAVRVRAGEICLFPNQDPEDWGQRRLFDIHSVRRDPGIPQVLKEVSDVLDQLEGQNGEEPLEIRKHLLCQAFDDMGLKEMEDYDRVRLYNYILRRSSRKYGVVGYSLRQDQYLRVWRRAWQLLLSCGEDRELYQLSQVVFQEVYQEELPPRNVVDDSFYDGMWRNAWSNVSQQILEAIEANGDMEALGRGLLRGKSREEAYEWLNKVYGRALRYMGEPGMRFMRVFPNQKGELRTLEELREDRTGGDKLKEIARRFADLERACDVYEYLLDRHITLHGVNLPPVREEDVAMRINRVVQELLAAKNLSDAEPEHQEACTALLGWIQENQGLAERYFPGFAKEEDQMRLLTPKAAVRIQRKAMECQTILEGLGASTAEEAMEKLWALKARAERENRRENEAAGGQGQMAWEDVAWDRDMEEEFGAVPEESRRDICREIGIGGERFALDRVTEYFLGQNYVKDRESGEEIWLHRDGEGGGSQVRIFYPDSRVYHQAGWDIQVTVTEGGAGEDYYLEVKTHTAGSVRGKEMYLSNEQMKAAARNRDRYVVLGVIYNYRQRRGERILSFPDPVRCIGDGRMVNRQKGYVFWLSPDEAG